MPEFLELLPPGIALDRFLEHIQSEPEVEHIKVKEALGRVSHGDIRAPHALPSFPRSTVDGYAVRAADTHGASDSMPIYLRLVGEVAMGGAADFFLESTQCGLIHTGGMLPAGADAVVMVENTQVVKPGEIEVLRATATGENVIKVGEDVYEGEIVIPQGSLIRAPEIGGLLALGITEIQVHQQPLVAIISSGDEVVTPEVDIGPGQVRDINSYTLSALIGGAGAIPKRYGIISDNEVALRAATSQALDECDLVVITAGSSASNRDLTARVIDSIGEPGVISHGVNVRPGKPTILAACEVSSSNYPKPVIGLPGNPVSAFVIALLFVEPVIDFIHGIKSPRMRPQVRAKVTLNLASKAGREDWIPVKLSHQESSISAEPIFGKSNLIFTLARADGLLHIPSQVTGLNSGDEVEVLLL
jgi:molybdopterin molybdotransferase